MTRFEMAITGSKIVRLVGGQGWNDRQGAAQDA